MTTLDRGCCQATKTEIVFIFALWHQLSQNALRAIEKGQQRIVDTETNTNRPPFETNNLKLENITSVYGNIFLGVLTSTYFNI